MRRKNTPNPDYLFKTTTHWRLRAEKMRALAEEAQESSVRAMMLRIAAEYDRLAGGADDPTDQVSIMFRSAANYDRSIASLDSGQTHENAS